MTAFCGCDGLFLLLLGAASGGSKKGSVEAELRERPKFLCNVTRNFLHNVARLHQQAWISPHLV